MRIQSIPDWKLHPPGGRHSGLFDGTAKEKHAHTYMRAHAEVKEGCPCWLVPGDTTELFGGFGRRGRSLRVPEKPVLSQQERIAALIPHIGGDVRFPSHVRHDAQPSTSPMDPCLTGLASG